MKINRPRSKISTIKCLWIDLFSFSFFFLLVQLVNLNWPISLKCAMKRLCIFFFGLGDHHRALNETNCVLFFLELNLEQSSAGCWDESEREFLYTYLSQSRVCITPSRLSLFISWETAWSIMCLLVSERRGGGMCDDLTRTSKNGQYCPFPVG